MGGKFRVGGGNVSSEVSDAVQEKEEAILAVTSLARISSIAWQDYIARLTVSCEPLGRLLSLSAAAFESDPVCGVGGWFFVCWVAFTAAVRMMLDNDFLGFWPREELAR